MRVCNTPDVNVLLQSCCNTCLPLFLQILPLNLPNEITQSVDIQKASSLSEYYQLPLNEIRTASKSSTSGQGSALNETSADGMQQAVLANSKCRHESAAGSERALSQPSNCPQHSETHGEISSNNSGLQLRQLRTLAGESM
jgi:hypothetical protein